MDKAVGKMLCPALVLFLLGLPLNGCGTRKSVPSESASSMKVPPASGTDTTMEPALKMGGNPGAVSGATANESISASPLLLYRIGPEDHLRISVWGNKELTLDVVVRPDGKISLPLIQDIQAEGLTPQELGDVIHQGLLAFIKDPHVSVIVLQINAPKYYVVGAVAKPGTYFLRGEVSVLQALSIAGGFTPFASLKNIRLVRNRNGRQDVRVINYFEVIENGSMQNYLVLPGDTIVVP